MAIVLKAGYTRYSATFRRGATCLAILLRHKLREEWPSVKHPATDAFYLLQSLRKGENLLFAPIAVTLQQFFLTLPNVTQPDNFRQTTNNVFHSFVHF